MRTYLFITLHYIYLSQNIFIKIFFIVIHEELEREREKKEMSEQIC